MLTLIEKPLVEGGAIGILGGIGDSHMKLGCRMSGCEACSTGTVFAPSGSAARPFCGQGTLRTPPIF